MERHVRGFYAIERGTKTDQVHRFETKYQRDLFVAGGMQRDVLTATHKLVKRALRYLDQGATWPVPIVREGIHVSTE